MAATGSFSLAGWTFNTWASGTDTITVNGTGGADTITGSTVNDTLNGAGGAHFITGGTGADTMSGGSASDTFFFAAGDAALTIGGSAMAGTVSGYDVITDFAAGTTAAASEKILFRDQLAGGRKRDHERQQFHAAVAHGQCGKFAQHHKRNYYVRRQRHVCGCRAADIAF